MLYTKGMFKDLIQKRLENSVRKYFAAHPEVKLVVVAGSIGKTSTKLAVGTVLAQQLRIRMHEDDRGSAIGTPLAILGVAMPEKLHSPLAWLGVFRTIKQRIKQSADVDVVVQELSIDGEGDMTHYSTYLRPYMAVVSGVTPEHMEHLKTIDTVAREELQVVNFSEHALINRDDIQGRFAEHITNPNISTYGSTEAAEYTVEIEDFTLERGYKLLYSAPELQNQPLSLEAHLVGNHSLHAITAAATVALRLGIAPELIVRGVTAIQPVPGRMNLLRGLQQSHIIDDTYNSSPVDAIAAIETLYGIDAPQRILLLGDMNELGMVSATEHEKLGQLCDPSLLSWVITVGQQSEAYLAPAARGRGCQVKSFRSALDAGAFVHSVLEPSAVVLAKGSRDGIYLEEAVKILLHETHEDHELVRQSEDWRSRKRAYFENL